MWKVTAICLTGLMGVLVGPTWAHWDPGDPYKWLQMPDLTPDGMDVDCTRPYALADDFLCTQTGPITDIHLWMSWWHNILPGSNPANVNFILRIYSDIPADQSPTGYSMPGTLLWSRSFPAFDPAVTVRLYYDSPEGWLTPPDQFEVVGDTQCWQYNFTMGDTGNVFIQQGGPDNPVVYWLEVESWNNYSPAKLGWKTSYSCPAPVGIGEARRLSYTYTGVPDGGTSNAERTTEFHWG